MNASPAEAPIIFEKQGHIAVVTLNRPAARNAVNAEMTAAVSGYLRNIEEDSEIRVAILASSDPRSFCAGADLKEIAAGRGKELVTPEGGLLGFVKARRNKPWIAAVTGAVVGGGMELALAADMVVAGAGSRFGLPETRRGLMAGAGGVFRMPRKIPQAVAIELLLTGEPFDAHRAYELGLVNRVVADEEVLAAALALATLVANSAPLAVRETLAMARVAADFSEEELWRLSAAATARLMATQDAKEGPRAFAEKRAPHWTGT